MDLKIEEMEKEKREAIIRLIKKEVVPAIGCTEPAAVSLAVAKATEMLGTVPEKITLSLSGNIIKNAMGVGIPGTGMIGLPIAVALGALVGKSEYGLEVLKDVDEVAVEAGRRYISENRISISHCEDAVSNLHIDVVAEGGGESARAVISGSHQNFIYLERNGARKEGTMLFLTQLQSISSQPKLLLTISVSYLRLRGLIWRLLNLD